MSIAYDDSFGARAAGPSAAVHPLLALMSPPLELERARAEEAAARELVETAEAALADAVGRVPEPLVTGTDGDAVREAAHALTASRARAVVAYRMLGPRPWLDADAEDAACRALDTLETAGAVTAARRRRAHLVLGVANLVALGLLVVSAFEVLVLAANPADLRVARVIVTAGALPVVAGLASTLGVVRAARQARSLRPALDDALRRSGCRTIRELVERRQEVDEWQARARHAAAAGDTCAEAIRRWYDVAGVGADAASVDQLVADVEWLRVARTTCERARFAHKVAAAQLERACAASSVAIEEVLESDDVAPPDALESAVARLRTRHHLIRWR